MAEIRLTSGGSLPQTVLPDLPPEVVAGLAAAGTDKYRLVEVAAAHPDLPEVWVALGQICETDGAALSDRLESYAYYRIGYHRGLDALRRNGWRGSGYVRWAHPTNRGFIASLDGLRRMAAAIGEDSESERCGEFLGMLDPSYEFRPGP